MLKLSATWKLSIFFFSFYTRANHCSNFPTVSFFLNAENQRRRAYRARCSTSFHRSSISGTDDETDRTRTRLTKIPANTRGLLICHTCPPFCSRTLNLPVILFMNLSISKIKREVDVRRKRGNLDAHCVTNSRFLMSNVNVELKY